MTTTSGTRHDVALTRAWVREGTSTLLAALESVADGDLDQASALEGWTRRHVLAHLARNAEALGRLLAWARTGVETPMYASSEQRAAEIETSARAEPARLRRELAATAAALDTDLAELPAAKWTALVRSARGRAIPAAEVPWMRAREVWLHAVDLHIGVSADRLPAEFARTLIDDVVESFAGRADRPAVQLTSGDRSWSMGPGGPVVSGEPAQLALWLTGRSAGMELGNGPRPEVPPWL